MAEQDTQMSRLNLEPYWMAFTANRDFKSNPRVITGARGHYYQSDDGRYIYDSFSGLWTTGLGHCHPRIVEAVQHQVGTLDYAMGFQIANDKAALLADRLTQLAPRPFTQAFFTNSGSEATETALKIALAYHRANGEAQRTKFIGRARGYHGTNFGGLSVGGMSPNRKVFSSNLLPGVDHLPHTFDLKHNAYSKGLPKWGAHLADELERLCELHDSTTIAAVIVEPVPGSTGVLPPPEGYLERLRSLCTKYGILLIFDEVITGFGRTGSSFAAERFNVMPDVITLAKGITNGVIPMGAVLTQAPIYEAMMHEPAHAVELFHGYTYSGHPVAAAAALATLETYEVEGTFEEARSLEPLFEECLHSFADHPLVMDVRNFGLMGAIELKARDGAPGVRGLETHKKCFWEENLIIRNGGDILQFSPFLNSKPDEMTMTFDKVNAVLGRIQ